MPPEGYITLRRAAERYGLSYAQLRLLARSGKLDAWRIERCRVTIPDAVATCINDQRKRSFRRVRLR